MIGDTWNFGIPHVFNGIRPRVFCVIDVSFEVHVVMIFVVDNIFRAQIGTSMLQRFLALNPSSGEQHGAA